MQNRKQTQEIPVVFKCQGKQLIGMIHQADTTAGVGVLMIVGGPQYRVGSHRQFVLLARYLAAQDIPVMRFDVRGMGDSEGQPRSFQQIDHDIRAAIDYFLEHCPTINHVVLWGLCDAASAALFYAYQDERVKGLVLLNPWVFTEKGAAKAYLKHYYLPRLFSSDLWHKIYDLKFDYLHSLAALVALFKNIINYAVLEASDINQVDWMDVRLNLPCCMRECMRRFKYPILLILSGQDLTADEFKETVKSDTEWQRLLEDSRISRYDFIEADHTFSSNVWRDQVALWTLTWVNGLYKSGEK
ncbi:MAG: hydrolase 1, exosortase A system-associated [Methylovulum sp.]|nr:hydrolase 1, exosortase A system-associated [Methylovulum sp.]